MSILVNELRLSLVWMKAFAKDELMPYLEDRDRYEEEFTGAKSGHGEWLLPWQREELQHFWQYYLNTAETGDLENVEAERAWDYLMPLRAPNWARIVTQQGLRLTLEGYCFPHSVGVVATAFINPVSPLPLNKMVDMAVKVRRADYAVAWPDGGDPTHGSLDNLADALIGRLHQKVLGQDPRGRPLSEPLTIATVIDAAGVWNAKTNLVPQIESALSGLCRLQPGWRKASPKPGGVALWRGEAATGDCLYLLERGRAIWMPKHFVETEPKIKRRALGCFHRNQALAALQTRSLTTLVRRAYEFLPAGPISFQLSNPVKRAIHVLKDLYLGEKTTYHTGSLRHQISYNMEMIEQVGQAVGEVWIE